jgi:hypothetical protein
MGQTTTELPSPNISRKLDAIRIAVTAMLDALDYSRQQQARPFLTGYHHRNAGLSAQETPRTRRGYLPLLDGRGDLLDAKPHTRACLRAGD